MPRFLKNILIVSLFIVALHIILGTLADDSTDNFNLRYLHHQNRTH